MNYLFNVKKDLIEKNSDINLYSGNVNTYTFSFNMDDTWNDFIAFGIFIKKERACNIKIENGQLTVPQQMLLEPGEISFGLYGTNGDDERISTNLITFTVNQGAYKSADAPKVYTLDVWEQLLIKLVPEIINGNWHIYDIKSETYVDTGVPAEGVTPKKGIDYFTDADKSELVDDVTEKAVGDIETALDSIIAIQNGLIGGDSI